MLCDSLEVWEGGSRGRGHMYTLMADSRCMIEINTTLESNYPPIKNKFKKKKGKKKRCMRKF